MTQTLPRPRTATASDRTSNGAPKTPDQVGSVWVRGAFAALSSAAIGVASLMVIVLAIWAADARSGTSAGAAIRIALDVWLVAHRVPVHVPGATIALAPLGLTLLLSLLISRGAAIVARGSRCATLSDLGIVVAAVAAPYAVIVTGCSVAARTTKIHTSPVTAFAAGLVIASVAATYGAARGSGLARTGWGQLPERVRQPAKAAGATVGVLMAAAALLGVVSVAVHLGAERRILSHDGGVSAQVSVGLLCLLLVPNLVGAATGFLAGPGFALGSGTSVSFTGTHLAALPAFPLVAAAPHHPSAAVAAVCATGFLAAGVTGGVVILRSVGAGLARQLEAACAAAAVTGCVVALITGLSGGPVGPGRMATIGPSPWRAGLAVSLEVGIGAVLVVLVWSWVRLARELVAAAPTT